MTHRRLNPGKQALVLGGVLIILLIAASPAGARALAWTVTSKNNLILVSPGSQGIGGGSYAAISSRGRYVAFESYAADLAPGHIEDSWDVFVSDLDSSQTARVSTRSDGQPVYNPGGYTSAPSMTGSGRYVAFMSRASDLVLGDDNAMPDIFLRDRQTETTTLVSAALDGGPANGPSFTPAISADGRFVAFQSMASNLVEGDTNDAMDVFVRDVETGETRRVSITDSGEEGVSPYEYPSSTIAISGDGRLVAFAYEGLPYPGLIYYGEHVYVRDQQANTTQMIAPGRQPAFSTDGGYLVFLTEAPLTKNDGNYLTDVYLFDRQTEELERISLLEGSEPTEQEILSAPDVSDDGRYVVYESNAGYLTGFTGSFNIYLRDRQLSQTIRIDRSMDGLQSVGESHNPVISDDGSRVAFTSTVGDLVPNDHNNASDVFVYLNNTPSIITTQRWYYLPLFMNN